MTVHYTVDYPPGLPGLQGHVGEIDPETQPQPGTPTIDEPDEPRATSMTYYQRQQYKTKSYRFKSLQLPKVNKRWFPEYLVKVPLQVMTARHATLQGSPTPNLCNSLVRGCANAIQFFYFYLRQSGDHHTRTFLCGPPRYPLPTEPDGCRALTSPCSSPLGSLSYPQCWPKSLVENLFTALSDGRRISQGARRGCLELCPFCERRQ